MNPFLENMSISISLIVLFPISASKDSKKEKFEITVFKPEMVGSKTVPPTDLTWKGF